MLNICTAQREPDHKRRWPAQAARDREIIRLVAMGVTYDEIGKQYGISRQRVHQIVHRDKSR